MQIAYLFLLPHHHDVRGFSTTKEMMARNKSTLVSTLAALQKAETQVEKLRRQAASERAEQLKGLHLEFGFESRKDLIEALVALDGTRRRGDPGSGKSPTTTRKSRRARLTPEMKAEIVEAVKAGESPSQSGCRSRVRPSRTSRRRPASCEPERNGSERGPGAP